LGSFKKSSKRFPFSEEGAFTFSKASFKGGLHDGLKRSLGAEEGFEASSKGFKKGLKEASGLHREGGLKEG